MFQSACLPWPREGYARHDRIYPLPFGLPAVKRKQVTADFVGGLLSADGWLVLLREAEPARPVRIARGVNPGVARFRAGGSHAAKIRLSSGVGKAATQSAYHAPRHAVEASRCPDDLG